VAETYRRYQLLPVCGYCTACQESFHSPAAELAAARHTVATGHETRVTRTQLVIIGPPEAAEL
jgi:hypothetical protein